MVNAFSQGSAKFPDDLDVRSKPNFADTKCAFTRIQAFSPEVGYACM